MDWLIWVAIAASVAAVLVFPTQTKSKARKRKKYPTSGAVLFGIQEVFQPSAANASVVQEEQKQSRRETPSPEDLLRGKPEKP